VKAAGGRLFTAEVDRARGASPSGVISYAVWKQRFGLDPAILGKTIRIHQTPFEIVGSRNRDSSAKRWDKFPTSGFQ